MGKTERTGDGTASIIESGLVNALLRAVREGSDIAGNGTSLSSGSGDEGQDNGVGELHFDVVFGETVIEACAIEVILQCLKRSVTTSFWSVQKLK